MPPFPSALLCCHDGSCSAKVFAKDSVSLPVSLNKTASFRQSQNNAKETRSKLKSLFLWRVLPDLVSPMCLHGPFGEFEGGTDSHGSGGDIQQPCRD